MKMWQAIKVALDRANETGTAQLIRGYVVTLQQEGADIAYGDFPALDDEYYVRDVAAGRVGDIVVNPGGRLPANDLAEQEERAAPSFGGKDSIDTTAVYDIQEAIYHAVILANRLEVPAYVLETQMDRGGILNVDYAYTVYGARPASLRHQGVFAILPGGQIPGSWTG